MSLPFLKHPDGSVTAYVVHRHSIEVTETRELDFTNIGLLVTNIGTAKAYVRNLGQLEAGQFKNTYNESNAHDLTRYSVDFDGASAPEERRLEIVYSELEFKEFKNFEAYKYWAETAKPV